MTLFYQMANIYLKIYKHISTYAHTSLNTFSMSKMRFCMKGSSRTLYLHFKSYIWHSFSALYLVFIQTCLLYWVKKHSRWWNDGSYVFCFSLEKYVSELLLFSPFYCPHIYEVMHHCIYVQITTLPRNSLEWKIFYVEMKNEIFLTSYTGKVYSGKYISRTRSKFKHWKMEKSDILKYCTHLFYFHK